MAAEQGNRLFANCIFAIVLNRELSKNVATEIRRTLEGNAGTVIDFNDDTNLEDLTHIISATVDFPQYSDSRLYMIPVVKPNWISQSLLRNKEAQYRPYSPDPNLIFSDITISCADIPTGDKDAIIGAVLAMGGMETSTLTRSTTHICALSIDHPKCQQILDKKIKCKIVLPHWFDDCLKLGKRIDERPYLLPDPEIFRIKTEDALPIAVNKNVQGASSPHPETFPLPTESPCRRLDVFKGKRVMISEDLALSNRLRKVIEDLLVGGGGSVTTSIYNADMYVCRYREGRDYTIASRGSVDVGNLAWLYFMIVNNEWTSPLRRLLHYPLPKNGIPGFENFKITLSNYGGEARTYLENLITASGGEFTKSMKQDNTHLITARKSSEKCDAAIEWGVEMINHLWIEESYATCSIQRLSDPRYSHFPPRTNLGEVIGQTQFDKNVLEDLYFPTSPAPSPNDTRPKRPAMHEKDRNTPASKKVNDDVVTSGQDKSSTPISESKKIVTRRRPALTQVSTPASRRVSTGKENDTPSTGSRSAKAKAVARIHNLGPDIALYEKEKKRKGPVWGGERAANQIEKRKSVERSKSPANEASEDESADEESRPAKRRRSFPPRAEINVLITSYKRWLNNPSKEEADKRKLRDLGIKITQDAKHCTHLAAPSIVRTRKFLCALASGPTIVSTDFIDACIQKGVIPDEEDFLLKDPENEKKFNIKLKDAVTRARVNNRTLFGHVPIYCTSAILNGADTFKTIVEANGGTFGIYTGKPVIKVTNPEDDDGPAEPVYLITGQKPEERKLWSQFTEMAKKGNMIPRVVETDWLLDVVLSQKLQWNSRYLVEKK